MHARTSSPGSDLYTAPSEDDAELKARIAELEALLRRRQARRSEPRSRALWH